MPNLDKDFYLDKQGLRQLVNELETNIVASEYDTSVSYSVGQYCIYENNFYRCTIATTGAWDSTDWVKVVISDEIPTIHSITTAQWEALTPQQKASGDYVITDATTVPLTAENVPYDDTVSGLTADNVQDAIDELSQSSGASSVAQLEDVQLNNLSDNDLLVYDSNLTGGKLWKNAKKIVTCTQAQFDDWSANDTFPYTDCKYIVTDAPNTNGTSEDLSYDGGVTSTHDVIADIITNYGFEEDSSGVWTWRKWNNGTLELWGDSNEIYSGTFNAWGNVYSLDVAGLGNYPVTFTRIDFMTGSCCLGGANGAGTLTNTSDALSGIAPGYIIVRGTNIGATDRNLYKTLYVKGKWK